MKCDRGGDTQLALAAWEEQGVHWILWRCARLRFGDRASGHIGTRILSPPQGDSSQAQLWMPSAPSIRSRSWKRKKVRESAISLRWSSHPSEKCNRGTKQARWRWRSQLWLQSRGSPLRRFGLHKYPSGKSLRIQFQPKIPSVFRERGQASSKSCSYWCLRTSSQWGWRDWFSQLRRCWLVDACGILRQI